MSCEEALVLISGHLDHENTAEEEAQLQRHLEVCPACRSLLDTLREMENGFPTMEEVPDGLCDRVMDAIRAEAPVKKKRRVWPVLAAAAAVALVIGVTGLPTPVQEQPAEVALVADYAADDMVMYSARSVSFVLPQAVAEERHADVVVTSELLPEMEVCPCETLEDGSLLYHLPEADDAAELSRIYGMELCQPATHTEEGSYALLVSE